MVTLKSAKEIESISKACKAVAVILREMTERVEAGVTTYELDKYAESRCKELSVVPAFKGYKGFPACVCISVNNEVVHGIPSKKKVLKAGDIVGLDFGVHYDGWYGDSAKSVIVGGKSSPLAEKLVHSTEQSLMNGIEACREGNRLYDIGYAVQKTVEPLGFSVVREFVGHGIGRALHEDPQVPNFGSQGKGIPLKVGMVLAIEPMINAGRPEIRILDDGWTAVTADGALSAHFEHTVAILPDGPKILTVVE